MIQHAIQFERIFIWSDILLLFCCCFVGCSYKGNTGVEEIIPPSKLPKDGVFVKRGEGSFVYTKYVPLANKPITIYYYIPTKGNIADMPVLFSMHGSDRDGTIQRNAWEYFAEANGFVVIAPEYSFASGYNENYYQFGGVFATSAFKQLNPDEQWTYQSIEAIFDYYKKETNSKVATYNIFGHSAGGQFVGRFMLAMPNARVNIAVAANPGSWTFPYISGIVGTDDKVYGWPYSVKDSPFATDIILAQFFSKKLWIQLGQLDTDTDDPGLPQSPAADAQGLYRLAKGRFFYEEAKRIAQKKQMPYHFQLAEVEQSGHSTIRMVYGRAVPKPSDISGTGKNCAFDLIFK